MRALSEGVEHSECRKIADDTWPAVRPAARPAKPQRALDLYIEAMEVLSKEQTSLVRETLAKLRSVAAAASTQTEPSVEKAFRQRKCRRLLRYPTMDH